jgi:hypothetical protein
VSPTRKSDFQISWMTITYRSVAIVIILAFVIALAALYLFFPDSAPVRLTSELGGKLMQMIGLASETGKSAFNVGPQQAHFTNVDGTVRVKKSNSNTWIPADYGLPLEKGDVVQTSSEGMAKIVFPDGTNYAVKQDSLIVIEENSANAQQQTQVAVQVTTGTVDLTTANFSQGSKSQVIVAGASASFAPDSAAVVHNDNRADQHDILLRRGGGEVTRGNERVVMGEYERVSFKSDSSLARTKEIGPPTLITPSNMTPVYVNVSGKPIDFSWSPVPTAKAYRVRLSKNPYFSSTVMDRTVQDTEFRMPGLKDGTYYWLVLSLDDKGGQSVESERNQFTVVTRAAEQASLPLDLDTFIQHGHVIEVKGKTDPTARVMVNGQEVAMVGSDGTFHYFTPPLPVGENMITVTAQNARGAVKTQQKKVVIGQ